VGGVVWAGGSGGGCREGKSWEMIYVYRFLRGERSVGGGESAGRGGRRRRRRRRRRRFYTKRVCSLICVCIVINYYLYL
jgi:hypothetical protein